MRRFIAIVLGLALICVIFFGTRYLTRVIFPPKGEEEKQSPIDVSNDDAGPWDFPTEKGYDLSFNNYELGNGISYIGELRDNTFKVVFAEQYTATINGWLKVALYKNNEKESDLKDIGLIVIDNEIEVMTDTFQIDFGSLSVGWNTIKINYEDLPLDIRTYISSEKIGGFFIENFTSDGMISEEYFIFDVCGGINTSNIITQ